MSSKYEDELGLIVMDNCKELGNKIDQNIMQRRSKKDSFIIPTNLVRFNNGLECFNKAFEEGLFEKLYSTNLTYVDKDALTKPWYEQIDCSNYASDIINTLNTSGSISELKNGKQKILTMLQKKKNGEL